MTDEHSVTPAFRVTGSPKIECLGRLSHRWVGGGSSKSAWRRKSINVTRPVTAFERDGLLLDAVISDGFWRRSGGT